MNCPQCQADNPADAIFCGTCGADLQPTAPVSAARGAAPAPLPQWKVPPPVTPEPLPPGKRAWEVETRVLPEGGAARGPLPEGELLHARRYQIATLQEQDAAENVYTAYDALHRICTTCGSAASPVDEPFCVQCGADGSGQPVQHPAFLLRESTDATRYAREAVLAERTLAHPGLLLPRAVFDHLPYGTQPRRYLVSDPEPGQPFATLPHPQPEERVLWWGQQLAEALAALHAEGIVHRNLTPGTILLDGEEQPRLTGFGFAEPLGEEALASGFAEDVQALLLALRPMLQGQPLVPTTVALFGLDGSAPAASARTAPALVTAFDHALAAWQRPTDTTLLVGRRTDVGRQRALNEDSLLVLEHEQVLQSRRRALGLYAVADGMGGHDGGEVASRIIVSALAQGLGHQLLVAPTEGSEPDWGQLLHEAVQAANGAVYEEGRQRGSDLGSTLVAALVVDGEVWIANVGDSRAYAINEGGIWPLTTDHSLVQRLVAANQITRAEARVHPQRNVIYRTMGDNPKAEADLVRYTLRRGDHLLLCSDGLHGLVEDAQIHAAVCRAANPQQACETLIRLANDAGGDDNITALLVQLHEAGAVAKG